jgi:hypothetical protein
VVECDGLENRCTFRRTVGSNPTPSANFISVIDPATSWDWTLLRCLGTPFPDHFPTSCPAQPTHAIRRLLVELPLPELLLHPAECLAGHVSRCLT